MRTRYRAVVSLVGALSFCALSLSNAADSLAPVGVFAPPGEKTFEQRYGVKLPLPMSERDFLATVNKLGLKYSSIDPREPGGFEKPRQMKSYDMSDIASEYFIEGDVHTFLWGIFGTVYSYLALVNRQHAVVYVETQVGEVAP